MVGAAPLLHELLATVPGGTAAAMSEPLHRRWQEMLGRTGLSRRLAWAGPAGPDPVGEGWEDWLNAALAAPAGPPPPGCLDPAAPLPFEEALLPFLAAFRAELAKTAGAGLRRLSQPVLASLERGLLHHLSHIALPTLQSEFALARILAGRLSWCDRPGVSDGYRAFVADMQAGGLSVLLAEYPALARLLAGCARNWAEACGRLTDRLERDWPRLAARGLAAGEGRVAAAAWACSDPHDGGQSVAILQLGAIPAVYKPRPIDMEAGLAELLDWANCAGFSCPFRPPGLVSGQDYGWMEYVPAAPCPDEAAVRRFYTRSGGLFCLWWLLQGTDLHYENLIASGEQPVIVDCETLLHPRLFPAILASLGPGTGHERIEEGDFARALRESGFLPSGAPFDVAAWRADETAPAPFRATRCHAANSDAMDLRHEPFVAPPRPHLPVLDGKPAAAAAHADTIVAGFTAMYRLVIADRDGFAAVLDGFAGRRGRFIARSTNAYGLLLNASFHPDWLREGPARGILFERLRREALTRSDRPACWALLDSELAALERMDVPRFSSRCDRATPCWPAPLDQARARLAGLSHRTLAPHAAALRRALSDLAAATSPPRPPA